MTPNLSGKGSAPVNIPGRRTALPVTWLRRGRTYGELHAPVERLRALIHQPETLWRGGINYASSR